MPRPVLVSLLLIGLAASASAHDPGLSSLAMRYNGSRVDALVTFAPADLAAVVPLDRDEDGSINGAEFQRALPELTKVATGAAVLQAHGGPIKPSLVVVERVELPGNDNIQARLSFAMPTADSFAVRLPLLERLPFGHRQHATVRDSEGTLLVQRILDKSDPCFEIPIAAAHNQHLWTQAFWSFAVLGVEHIAVGYDHLLFLLALLIVGSGVRAAAVIITSFTVAHSITLALAAFGLIRLPPSVVEPLIAASIVYVGVENIWLGRGRNRWLLTFGFGLIHGLGFASVLEEFVLDGQSLLLPLLSFNLGVELGQLAIAAIFLPLVWACRRQEILTQRHAAACSFIIALVGAYWLAERTIL